MGKEQRQDPRLELPIAGAFRVKEGGSWHEATIKNLSAGGAALTTPFEVPSGNKIHSIRFRLPSDDGQPERWIETPALVLRSGPTRKKKGVPQRILAVKFMDMDELSARRVQTFVFSEIMDSPDRWRKLRPANKRLDLGDAGAVKMRFDTLSDFETQFIGNISTGGMFIESESPHPPGTVFDFELLLGEDLTLVAGQGEVLWIREPHEGSERPPGMGVRFVDVDDVSISVVQRVLETHGDTAEPAEEEPSGPTASSSRTQQSPRAVPSPSVDPEEPTPGASPAAAVARVREMTSDPLIDRAREEMRTQRDRLLESQRTLHRELNARDRSRFELERKLEQAQSAAKELETHLTSASARNERLRAGLERKEVLLVGLREELELEQANAASLGKDSALRTAALQSVESRLAAEQELREERESRLTWSHKRLAELDEALHSTFSSLRQVAEDDRSVRVDRERELDFALHESRHLRHELKQANSLQTVFELQSLWDESTIRNFAKGLVKHHSRALAMQGNLNEARREIEELYGVREKLERDLEASRSQNHEAQGLLTTAHREFEELKSLHGKLAAKRQPLESRLAESQQRNSTLEAQFAPTLEKVDGLERQSATLTDEHRRLSDALDAAATQEKELREQVRASEVLNEEGAAEISRLEKALSATKQRLQTMNDAATVQESKLSRLEKDHRRTGRAVGPRRRRMALLFVLGGLSGILAASLAFGLLRERASRAPGSFAGAVPSPAADQIAPPAVQPDPATTSAVSPSSSEPEAAPFNEAAIIDAVRSWAEAWAGQRVSGYLDSYSDRFEPPFGASRADWEELRRQRLSTPEFISIDLSDLEVSPGDDDGAVVVFEQVYKSPDYSDRTRKRLEMELSGNVWKILVETGETVPVPP